LYVAKRKKRGFTERISLELKKVCRKGGGGQP